MSKLLYHVGKIIYLYSSYVWRAWRLAVLVWDVWLCFRDLWVLWVEVFAELFLFIFYLFCYDGLLCMQFLLWFVLRYLESFHGFLTVSRLMFSSISFHVSVCIVWYSVHGWCLRLVIMKLRFGVCPSDCISLYKILYCVWSCLVVSFDFSPGMILYRMEGMRFSVALLMWVLKF